MFGRHREEERRIGRTETQVGRDRHGPGQEVRGVLATEAQRTPSVTRQAHPCFTRENRAVCIFRICAVIDHKCAFEFEDGLEVGRDVLGTLKAPEGSGSTAASQRNVRLAVLMIDGHIGIDRTVNLNLSGGSRAGQC